MSNMFPELQFLGLTACDDRLRLYEAAYFEAER